MDIIAYPTTAVVESTQAQMQVRSDERHPKIQRTCRIYQMRDSETQKDESGAEFVVLLWLQLSAIVNIAPDKT